MLQEAIALHNGGRLDDADRIYRKVLQQVPRHPDALHLRALVCHAREQFAEAGKLADAATAVAPGVANFYNTAGEAYRRLGRLDKARQRLSEAIRLDSAMSMALHNLSLVSSAEGRHQEALQLNQRALVLNPEYVDALAHSIDIAFALDDEGRALTIVRRLEEFPAGDQVALAIARYHEKQGWRHLERSQLREAEQSATAAIAIHPVYWGGWSLWGEVALNKMEFSNAELYLTLAVNLAPENADARLNLAILLEREKHLDDSAAHLRAFLSVHPGNAMARFSLASSNLMRGDYKAGWLNYEARWNLPTHQGKFAGAPQWDGKELDRLLLYSEQGLGDSVQMLRFLPEVLRRCRGSVTLQVQEPLARLARRVFSDCHVVVVESLPDTQFEAACALMSLPSVIGVDAKEQMLGNLAYLSADAGRTEVFARRLACKPGKKLGFIWRGAAGSKINRMRVLPEEALIPLLDLPGWTPVSLQFGVKDPQIASRRLLDLSDAIHDFDDLAAAMVAVDAVVSLDTGPAHLAGALGVPVYTLLPWVHDWRWGSEGETCDWYSSMVLFRQTGSGNWQEPVKALVGKLTGQIVSASETVGDTQPDRLILRNQFPFVSVACRYGTFSLPLLDKYITRSMLAYGEYSPREAELLRSFLRTGDVVIDVGANLGTLTLAMATAVGPSGRVIAIEPQEMIHRCLAETLEQNGMACVELRRQAVGATAGTARIGFSDPTRPGNFGGIPLTDGIEGDEVEMIRLDDLDLQDCRLIKIDIEGMELDALRGATRLIAECRPVLYVECDRPGKSEPLIALLKGLSYRVFMHHPPLFSAANFRNRSVNLFPGLVSGNLLALPPGESPPPDAVAIP